MFIDDEMQNNTDEVVNSSNNPFETKEEEQTCEEENKDPQEENEDECEALKIELEDLNNKYLRLAADFDNFRKRQAQERESLLKYGAQETMTKLLAVLDTFERAQESVKDNEDCKCIKESYDVAIKMFIDTLKKAGLEPIEAVGEEFDPNLHEAIAQTPTTEHPDNTVVSQLQTGYKLADRVLRPALVNVAKNEE